MRASLTALAAAVLLAGCSSTLETTAPASPSLPSALSTTSPATTQPKASPAFVTQCDPPPAIAGPHLGCTEAINAALELLGSGRPPIEAVVFHYDCPGNLDCAVQLSGTVQVTYAGQPNTVAVVGVWPSADGGGLTTQLLP